MCGVFNDGICEPQCSMSHGFLIFFVDNSYGGFLCAGVWVRVWGVYFFSDVPLDVTW